MTTEQPSSATSAPPQRRRSGTPVLSARSLVKHYGARAVVQEVSLDVAAGQIVGLLGPNGAGKTTSFYMIVGLVAADQGEIRLNGHDVTVMPVDQRARLGLGYLPQEASVFRKLSVEDNILGVLSLRRDLNKKQQKAELEDLLTELHIRHIRKNLGQSLSGGERRRVEIARALAANPAVMLLDEPFAGVDPISVIDIQRIIRHLSERGIAVLITDHNVRETLGVCEHAYIVSDGHILAQGTPEDILADEQVRAVYLGKDFNL